MSNSFFVFLPSSHSCFLVPGERPVALADGRRPDRVSYGIGVDVPYSALPLGASGWLTPLRSGSMRPSSITTLNVFHAPSV